MRTKLTDTEIRSTKSDGRPIKLTDGGGLYLEVRPSGAKLWRYRYRIGGKENVFAAGEYVQVPKGEGDRQGELRRKAGRLSLLEARTARAEWADLVSQGIHPAHSRRLQAIQRLHDNTNTLRALGEEWIASRDWEPATKQTWRQMFERHVYPELGSLPIKQIEPPHILAALKKIEAKAPATAAQARRGLSGIFELAIATLRAERDPVWPVRKAIKVPRTIHKKALDLSEVGRLLRLVEDSSATLQTKIALRMLWYTLARPSEVIEARWSEFDLESATWKIPAERMKMRAIHTIPLPAQAVALLSKLRVLTGDRELLFPNRDDRRRPASDNTLRVLVRELGFAGIYSPHATRVTGSTLLNEMGYRPDAIERQLAHGDKDTVRSTYNHAKYLDERREMMQVWADLIDNVEAGNSVIPLRKYARDAANG